LNYLSENESVEIIDAVSELGLEKKSGNSSLFLNALKKQGH